MVTEYEIDGLKLKTGDLICTSDGGAGSIDGQFWRLVGKLIPGDVDHIVVYVGPDGRCVEAGAKGKVVFFNIRNNRWNAICMRDERGPLIDRFYGIAYPLAERTWAEGEEEAVRSKVAAYCIEQAERQKPYNLNFLDSATDSAFYCSQLAYKAYLGVGIDLNTNKSIPHIPGTESIVFPQEIWEGCSHLSVA